MNARVGGHLEACKERGIEDRRNGSYSRRLLMGVGDVELRVPRTRTYIPLMGLERYARGAPEIDRLILAAFVLGLSTRKVGKALLHLLGESVSASTVSKGARQLDAEVAAWHRRRLSERYRVLMFDGVALSRKTGAGAIRRPVLVALGIRPDGKKEVIDFRLAQGESQAAWETFPNELYNRGLEAGEVWSWRSRTGARDCWPPCLMSIRTCPCNAAGCTSRAMSWTRCAKPIARRSRPIRNES